MHRWCTCAILQERSGNEKGEFVSSNTRIQKYINQNGDPIVCLALYGSVDRLTKQPPFNVRRGLHGQHRPLRLTVTRYLINIYSFISDSNVVFDCIQTFSKDGFEINRVKRERRKRRRSSWMTGGGNIVIKKANLKASYRNTVIDKYQYIHTLVHAHKHIDIHYAFIYTYV